MKIEDHLINLKESLDVLDYCRETGYDEKQRTIGFHTSSACADMLEILLHKKNLIDSGFMIKHEWFKAPNKVKEKLSFDFPKKKEILNLAKRIEEKRNLLCYGKKQSPEFILENLEDFNKIKVLFKEAGLDEL